MLNWHTISTSLVRCSYLGAVEALTLNYPLDTPLTYEAVSAHGLGNAYMAF